MLRYYTRVCNFYYGSHSRKLVKNKKLVNLNDMNELKYVKKITTKEFEQDNTIYNIFSSLREKVNAPARNRTNKD